MTERRLTLQTPDQPDRHVLQYRRTAGRDPTTDQIMVDLLAVKAWLGTLPSQRPCIDIYDELTTAIEEIEKGEV